MELIKWLFSTAIAIVVAVLGIGLVIGTVIFSTLVKLLGLVTIIAAGIAVMIKEKIDERSNKD